jgi:hypothetical protein
MPVIFKGEEAVKTSHSFEADEWGNVIQTSVHVFKNNKISNILAPTGLPDMASDSQRSILSRSMTFDEGSQTTTLEQRSIYSYASSAKKRLSIDANSGTEPITANPRFQDLAGTPETPNETNALWVASNDTESTKRFVEFKKPGLVGVSSYIAGNGCTLKVTYFDIWSAFAQTVNDIGKISFPPVPIWGTTLSWLLAGATAEPFGDRWKITLLYRNASANYGQYSGEGWSTLIYS